MMKIPKEYIFYVLRFIAIFCVLYYGTLAIIGLSAPEGYYSPFVAKYLDYIEWFRASLLLGSKALLSILGYKAYIPNKYEIFVVHGGGVRMVYSCIGYGVMSFWGAFVIANKGTWTKKAKWLLGGWLALSFINVWRVSLLVIAINKGWEMPFGVDHHTWFNIAAYILIFVLIYFYDRSGKTPIVRSDTPKHS